MPDVHPDMVVGSSTAPVAGGRLHRHSRRDRVARPSDLAGAVRPCLAGGTTTLVGNGSGPVFDVGSGATATFGRFLQAIEFSPLNYALFGRGGSSPEAVEEAAASGGMSVKIHEDFGAAPDVIDKSLRWRRRIATISPSISIPTRSTNTASAKTQWRPSMAAPSTCTTCEGAGGGHAPDLLKVVSWENVIPSSTNPTNPYTSYGMEEGVPMTMICHQLNYNAPEDVPVRRGSRARAIDGRRGFSPRHGRDLDLRHRHAGHRASGRERREMLATRQRHEGPHRALARRGHGACGQ